MGKATNPLRTQIETQKNNILLNIFVILMIASTSLIIYVARFSPQFKISLYGGLGFILLLFGMNIFYRVKKTNINVYTFFYSSYFAFSYGQIMLYALGIRHSQRDVIHLYSENEIVAYCLFFVTSTCALLFGALVAVRKDKKKLISESEHISKKNRKNLDKSFKIVAWLLFFASAPVYFSNLLDAIQKTIIYGYGSFNDLLLESTSTENLLAEFRGWFIPSVLFLLVLHKNNKSIKYLMTVLSLVLIIGNFLSGGRTNALSLLLTLVFLWNAEIKQFSKKQKIVTILLLIVVLSLLPILASYRTVKNKTLFNFIEFLFTYESNNLIIDLIAELGGSMQTWLMVNRLIPLEQGFALGQSYIASILAVIPSLFLGGYSFTQYANLSNWLKVTENLTYGPGFSMLAEAYYNFGWAGPVLMSVIGWLYFKLLSMNWLRGPAVRYKNVFSAIILQFVFTAARSSLYLTVRQVVYYVILPVILVYLLYNTFKNNTV